MSLIILCLNYSDVFSAILGGFATAVVFPIVNYFFIRCLNTCRIKIKIDDTYCDSQANYTTNNLRIINSSCAHIKDLYVYVKIIDLEDGDIVKNNANLKTFVEEGKVNFGMLSWAKNINNSNLPNNNLNQGETADVNFIRFHNNTFIEIASEHGFSEMGKDKKTRILLENKEYKFEITVTGESMFRKKATLKWDMNKLELVKGKSCSPHSVPANHTP